VDVYRSVVCYLNFVYSQTLFDNLYNRIPVFINTMCFNVHVTKVQTAKTGFLCTGIIFVVEMFLIRTVCGKRFDWLIYIYVSSS